MQKPRWINGVEPPAQLLHANGTQILEIECREQPQRLIDLLRAYSTDSEIRSQLRNFRQLAQKTGPILFIGMGASYCSSFSASVTLSTHGRPSFSADAGEWLREAMTAAAPPD
ncbi:MAG: sugar isomerase, partial [Acidobacteriota bacterium]